MDIFLVRHGEAAASWGQSADPGLSELGREQAAAAAQSLAGRFASPPQLISSPLQRAQETAAPLADQLGLPVSIDSSFAEIPAPVPLAQRQDWLRAFMRQRWDEQPDSLWAWRNAALRGLGALEQPTAVFSHFLVINAVVGAILEHPDTLYFWPDNGSITHLRLERGNLALVETGADMKTVVN